MSDATTAATALAARRWRGTTPEQRTAALEPARRARWRRCAGCNRLGATAGPLVSAGDPDDDGCSLCPMCRTLVIFSIHTAGGCTHPQARQAAGWNTGCCLPCLRNAIVAVRRWGPS